MKTCIRREDDRPAILEMRRRELFFDASDVGAEMLDNFVRRRMNAGRAAFLHKVPTDPRFNS